MLLARWASLFGCSVLWWWMLLTGIRRGDPESGLTMGRKDLFYAAVTAAVNPVVTGLAYPESRITGLFFTSFLTILAVNGWVDCKTHLVYRFYSLVLIGISLLFLVICRLTGQFPAERSAELVLTTGLVLAALLLFVRFHIAGLGDVMNLFPCAIFLCILMAGQTGFLLEAVLIHYILACIIMVVTNLPSFRWRGLRSKMTERIPFVADIYGAAVIMMLARIGGIMV